MNQQLQIEGRSGCPLNVEITNGHLRVIKTSSHSGYNSRLREQAKKQQQFSSPSIDETGFFAPHIYEFNEDDDLYWFSMDYITGLKYSSYLTTQNKYAIDEVVNKFKRYFTHLFAESNLIDPPEQLISDKVDQLRSGIQTKVNSAVFKRALDFLKIIPQQQIYSGKCHGDFTLSNMLFLRSGKICTFDMLDSFIDTPVMDWVKLKQDTTYKWSIHIENQQFHNHTKLIQVLNYIDRELNLFFENDGIINSWETYMQVLNLMRIVPYAKDQRDITFLETTLTKLL